MTTLDGNLRLLAVNDDDETVEIDLPIGCALVQTEDGLATVPFGLSELLDVDMVSGVAGNFLAKRVSPGTSFTWHAFPTFITREDADDVEAGYTITRGRVRVAGAAVQYDFSDDFHESYIATIGGTSGERQILLPTPDSPFSVIFRAEVPVSSFDLVWAEDVAGVPTLTDLLVLSDSSNESALEVRYDFEPYADEEGADAWAVRVSSKPLAGSYEAVQTVTADRDLTTADLGTTIYAEHATAITLTLPEIADVPLTDLPVGSFFRIVQLGAGAVTIEADTSTVDGVSVTTAQFESIVVQRIAEDRWISS